MEGRVAEKVEVAGGEGGGGNGFGSERVFGFDFLRDAGAEVVPSAVACNAGEEVEGVGACAVSVFDFAPGAAEGFLADGVAGAAFGDREGFDLGDDVVAEFVEAFRAGGVNAALMLYFAEEEGDFCGLFFHGFCFFVGVKVGGCFESGKYFRRKMRVEGGRGTGG